MIRAPTGISRDIKGYQGTVYLNGFPFSASGGQFNSAATPNWAIRLWELSKLSPECPVPRMLRTNVKSPWNVIAVPVHKLTTILRLPVTQYPEDTPGGFDRCVKLAWLDIGLKRTGQGTIGSARMNCSNTELRITAPVFDRKGLHKLVECRL